MRMVRETMPVDSHCVHLLSHRVGSYRPVEASRLLKKERVGSWRRF